MAVLRDAQKAVQMVKTKERGDDKEYEEEAENEIVGMQKGWKEGKPGQGTTIFLNYIFSHNFHYHLFKLHEVITFKVIFTILYFIIHRNKSQMMVVWQWTVPISTLDSGKTQRKAMGP